jgi:hypothetical protein
LAQCTYPNPIALGDPPLTITLTVQVTFAALPSVTNVATVSTTGDTDDSNDDDGVVNPVLPMPAPAPLVDNRGFAAALVLLLAVAGRKLGRRKR